MNQICPKCRSLFDDSAQSCPDDESHLIEDLTGEIIAERYLLERFIGIGGMRAPVWRARQTSTRRTVAIKLMPQREGRPAHRFEREARIASNLNHRHIVVVHEYGTDERDQLFLVMEFLHGVSLRRVLRTGHPLPLERVLHITEQVLRALEHAHKHNVVHRDLKPDNMMLTTQDDDPDFVKILDFGIAKYYASEPDEEKPGLAPDSHELTQDSVLCGTPLYMAPEQITGESFDARIDLYALGIVMYQMLTGRVPFSGKTSYEILSKQIGEAPPLFREVRPELALSSELEEVVLRALEKDPGLRYQTAREMRLALRDVRRAVGVITQDTDEPSWAGPLPTAPVGGAGGRRGGAMAAPPPPPQAASRTLDPVPDDHLTQTLHPPSHIPSQRRPRRGGPWIALAIVLAVGAGVALGLSLSSSEPSPARPGDVEEVTASEADAPRGKSQATSAAGARQVGAAPADDGVVELNLELEPDARGAAADAGPAATTDAGPPGPTDAGAVAAAGDAGPAAGAAAAGPPATLALEVTPAGALVELDGEPAGKAPLTLQLAVGRHDILIQAPAHGDELLEVEVRPEELGRALKRVVVLTPEPTDPAPGAAKPPLDKAPAHKPRTKAGTTAAPGAAGAGTDPHAPTTPPATDGAGAATPATTPDPKRAPDIELLDGSKRRPGPKKPKTRSGGATGKKPPAKPPPRVKVEILE